MPQAISSISRTVVRMTARHDYEDGSSHSTQSRMTGFLWKSNGEVFLVTNWHNLTGLRPDTLEPMGSFRPNVLIMEFYVCKEKFDGKDLIAVRNLKLSLYNEHCLPVWREHQKQNVVDLAAIKLGEECFVSGQPYCINEIDFKWEWRPEVGDECFVVGYPEGLVGPANSPIWKRASIATEPNHPIEREPEIFVDTLGNEGLSGSPVIAQSSGVYNPDGGSGFTLNSTIGTWRNFLGVYAGRTSEEGVGFQLGRDWNADLVTEVVETGVSGIHPSM